MADGLPRQLREEREERERVEIVLEKLNLQAHAHAVVRDLPYGTQKLVELARAMALGPRLMLLDEPAAGMNNREIDALGETLKRLQASAQATLLLIEHSMPLAAACLMATTLGAHAFENKDEGVLTQEIVLGSSQPLSGTLAYMGKAVDEGMRTYFDMVNEQGGVNGRKIKLITYDDELKPAKSVANAKLLVERDKIFAMVGNIGHATNISAYEYSSTKKVPTIGALSISDLTSNPARELLYVLPSPQSTETAAYIDHAVEVLKAKKIAMLYQNDGWGMRGAARSAWR